MWNTQQTIEKAEETLQNIKPEYKKLILADAQTSGGLLISCPKSNSLKLLKELIF